MQLPDSLDSLPQPAVLYRAEVGWQQVFTQVWFISLLKTLTAGQKTSQFYELGNFMDLRMPHLSDDKCTLHFICHAH